MNCKIKQTTSVACVSLYLHFLAPIKVYTYSLPLFMFVCLGVSLCTKLPIFTNLISLKLNSVFSNSIIVAVKTPERGRRGEINAQCNYTKTTTGLRNYPHLKSVFGLKFPYLVQQQLSFGVTD